MTTYDVPKPEHGLGYLSQLPQDRDGSEVVGFVMFDRVGDEDVLLWSCGYAIHGGAVNEWIVPEARTNGTIFFTVPSAGEGMQDNNFVRRGLQITDYLGPDGLQLDKSAEECSWDIAGRRYVWRTGEWQIQGTHAEVTTDLTLKPAAPALWTFGPFEDLDTNGFAGYDVAFTAEGTVTAGGRTYRLEHAVGSHERGCVGQGRDIMSELTGGQVFVGDCFSDDIHIFFARHPGRPMSFGRIDVGDTGIMFPSMEGKGTVHVTSLEHWNDPRSGLAVPSVWQVSMNSPEATLDLEVRYRGRGYWYYTTRSGVMVLMWMLGRANGSLYLANGEVRQITDAVVGSRWGQTILVTEETLDGPEFPVLRENQQ